MGDVKDSNNKGLVLFERANTGPVSENRNLLTSPVYSQEQSGERVKQKNFKGAREKTIHNHLMEGHRKFLQGGGHKSQKF